MEYIKITENGIHIVFGITEKNQLKLLHFSSVEFHEEDLCKFGPECKEEDLGRKQQFLDEAFQLVQVSLSGYDRPYEKHGNKHIVTAPGYLLTYAGMEDTVNEQGRRLTIYQEDKAVTHIRVETVLQFYNADADSGISFLFLLYRHRKRGAGKFGCKDAGAYSLQRLAEGDEYQGIYFWRSGTGPDAAGSIPADLPGAGGDEHRELVLQEISPAGLCGQHRGSYRSFLAD